MGVQCAISAALFTLLALADGHAGPPADGRTWLAIAWFVVLSTFGGYGFYWLNLRRGSVTRVSSLIYLTPPTTMAWGLLMFGEPVGPVALVGIAVCLGGVVLVRRGQASRQT